MLIITIFPQTMFSTLPIPNPIICTTMNLSSANSLSHWAILNFEPGVKNKAIIRLGFSLAHTFTASTGVVPRKQNREKLV